jgi:hypothetical protein
MLILPRLNSVAELGDGRKISLLATLIVKKDVLHQENSCKVTNRENK